VDLPGITMVSILAPGYTEDSGQAILSRLQERPMGTQPTLCVRQDDPTLFCRVNAQVPGNQVDSTPRHYPTLN